MPEYCEMIFGMAVLILRSENRKVLRRLKFLMKN